MIYYHTLTYILESMPLSHMHECCYVFCTNSVIKNKPIVLSAASMHENNIQTGESGLKSVVSEFEKLCRLFKLPPGFIRNGARALEQEPMRLILRHRLTT